MSPSRIICFRSGPYRTWTLRLWRCGKHDGKCVFVDVETPSPMLTGHVTLTEGEAEFDVVSKALWGGRDEMQAALQWLLDATVERLTDPDLVVEPHRRALWQAIVDRGRQAREEFTARYGDGPEPAFEVIHRLVYDGRSA